MNKTEWFEISREDQKTELEKVYAYLNSIDSILSRNNEISFVIHFSEDENNDPCIIIDNFIYINCGCIEDKNPTILGDNTTYHKGFTVSRMVSYPGVYRYADGSGEPPSEELVDEKNHRSVRGAASDALNRAWSRILDQAFEEREEAYMDHMEEEY